jgi:hypothetical protein
MTDTITACRGCEKAALHPGAACTKHGTPAPAVALPIAPVTDAPNLDDELEKLVDWLGQQIWSEFALSLHSFYHERGFLSAKQQAAAESMRAKVIARQKLATKPDETVPLEIPKGVHRNADGEIVKVYATQAGHLATKLLTERVALEGSEWEFVYTGKTKLAGLSPDTLLPMDEARKFGRLTSSCVNCLRPLSDERSLAAGYGPKCARNHGWWYPNLAEATEIIAREGLKLMEGSAS